MKAQQLSWHNGCHIEYQWHMQQSYLLWNERSKKMQNKRIRKSIFWGAIMLFATVAIAFAHGGDYGYGGYGMGPGMMGYGGYGGHMGYGPGPDRGYNANLSDAQRAKLDAAREAFFNDTRQLRDQIQEKRYSLNSELNKDNPDSAKVAQLQKELSQLDSEFDQKRIAYQLEVRKLLPENDVRSGFGPGFGNGYCW
jgi:zinc resistance-associated protein